MKDFEGLLFFLTGSRYLPTVGTITGKLNFKHQNIKEGDRVTVSTCAYGILFPVTQRYTGEHFTENIVDDILNYPIWESMSSHYSGQRLKPFVIYIQFA